MCPVFTAGKEANEKGHKQQLTVGTLIAFMPCQSRRKLTADRQSTDHNFKAATRITQRKGFFIKNIPNSAISVPLW